MKKPQYRSPPTPEYSGDEHDTRSSDGHSEIDLTHNHNIVEDILGLAIGAAQERNHSEEYTRPISTPHSNSSARRISGNLGPENTGTDDIDEAWKQHNEMLQSQYLAWERGSQSSTTQSQENPQTEEENPRIHEQKGFSSPPRSQIPKNWHSSSNSEYRIRTHSTLEGDCSKKLFLIIGITLLLFGFVKMVTEQANIMNGLLEANEGLKGELERLVKIDGDVEWCYRSFGVCFESARAGLGRNGYNEGV